MAVQGGSMLLSQPQRVNGDPAPHLTGQLQELVPQKQTGSVHTWTCMVPKSHVTGQTTPTSYDLDCARWAFKENHIPSFLLRFANSCGIDEESKLVMGALLNVCYASYRHGACN